ncbi:Heparin-sulfate lyase [Pontiella sulfatireligans]|uniref:Heparin-sulfate lyase n=1 Tax=Pontiella sulfatireligans TaxID=2750658 RepID=A0A6C2UFW5_9BACT|nr:Heparin-sulfate lyase [Pontiella sulfatireligans]
MVPFPLTGDLVERLSPAEKTRLIAKADAACCQEFDLLGSGAYQFKDRMDWHLDFKSGFRWPSDQVSHRLPSVTQQGVDIKIPWELSRFNHAVSMGLAWRLSGNRKYAESFVSQVEDWIANNPVGYGVNWACAMDVAIRAVNWVVAFSLFHDVLMKGAFEGFRKKLAGSLWKHARFIHTHLEWLGPKDDAGANHFLSDLTGLYTLGLFFCNTVNGKCWNRFAHKQIEEEMVRQVFPDGVHYECSLSYHRLCLEMFMWCEALATKTGQRFSAAYHGRLKKMQQFVADYVNPSGNAPMIGDNDDGRLLSSGLLAIGDHRYLMSQISDGTFFLERFLLDGTAAVGCSSATQSAAYPDGGFYFLKNNRAKVAVRAGRLAHAGGHAHNDQLSFELNMDGREVFVDRGSFVYTSDPDARNLYRSTVAHNVMQINGAEQNRFGTRLFGVEDETQAQVIEQSEFSLEAKHGGFRELMRTGAEYRRRLDLGADGLTITETVAAAEPGDVLCWFFHLAPGLTVRCIEERVEILDNDKPLCLLNVFPGAKVVVQGFPHSPSYGVQEDAKTLTVEYVIGDALPNHAYQFVISWGS